MLETCIGGCKTDIKSKCISEYGDTLNCCPNGGFFTGPNPVNRVASLRSYFISDKQHSQQLLSEMLVTFMKLDPMK